MVEGIEAREAVPGVHGSEVFRVADRLLGAVSLCGRMSGAGFPCGGPKRLGRLCVSGTTDGVSNRLRETNRCFSVLPP